MTLRYKHFQQNVQLFDHPFYTLTYIRNELFAFHTSVAGFAELLRKEYISDPNNIKQIGSIILNDMDYMRAIIEYTYATFAILLKPDE